MNVEKRIKQLERWYIYLAGAGFLSALLHVLVSHLGSD